MIDIEHIDALFNPKGVLVVGASTHPGKKKEVKEYSKI